MTICITHTFKESVVTLARKRNASPAVSYTHLDVYKRQALLHLIQMEMSMHGVTALITT